MTVIVQSMRRAPKYRAAWVEPQESPADSIAAFVMVSCCAERRGCPVRGRIFIRAQELHGERGKFERPDDWRGFRSDCDSGRARVEQPYGGCGDAGRGGGGSVQRVGRGGGGGVGAAGGRGGVAD